MKFISFSKCYFKLKNCNMIVVNVGPFYQLFYLLLLELMLNHVRTIFSILVVIQEQWKNKLICFTAVTECPVFIVILFLWHFKFKFLLSTYLCRNIDIFFIYLLQIFSTHLLDLIFLNFFYLYLVEIFFMHHSSCHFHFI